MRLLNTKSLQLEEFLDDDIPPYAILSHRWQEEEVTFRDMETAAASGKKGYEKLSNSCAQAAKDKLDYIWIDTCCIDKASSAELSESINCMYEWYRCSTVCYAYLFDVNELVVEQGSSFDSSVWFTRGWTLQELIAPSKLEFFNFQWHALGTKADLKELISTITRIPATVLTGEIAPQGFSVAQRMSWASKRTTAKVEDIAYSLLGLFSINMHMLYGEREKAFIRLQEEIMKQSDDHSLFAWTRSDVNYRGLFAKSPADFAESSMVVQTPSKWSRSPYSVSNMGLSIELPLIPWAMDTYLAALDCGAEGENNRFGIYIAFLPQKDQYARVELDGEDIVEFDEKLGSQCEYRRIYVKQTISGKQRPLEKLYGFWLRAFPERHPDPDAEFSVTSWNKWDHKTRILEIPTGQHGSAAIIRYQKATGRKENLKLGFDSMFNPVVQFGGQYYSPNNFGKVSRDDFKAMMGTDWMNPNLEGVHSGDRITGISVEDAWVRVLVFEEIVNGKRMWVVHIGDADKAAWHKDIICDGCELNVFGTLYKCRVCPEFDYCSNCRATDEAHKKHGFKTVTYQRHYGVKCDACGDTVYGTRHKCLDCNDFDLCWDCYKIVDQIHPDHRFNAIEKPK
ncbi:hypothetical protein AJ80_05426 [Polytolypa hystricis UAMH7299]|uniref:ZZ-type domain-containing protein n=1 Tax=Polytolypa hystricis (strain UAMH7299) TaxID=1447883 RepID=A0A2B7Y4E7_POLH7|nr:hypothetical protein AJ80_05426 [Polytolypa hystricis UAMH7299]